MKKLIHRADTRGSTTNEWLDSRHTFSFNKYYDPQRVHFGALRVLNDDRIAPKEGFESHPHVNMEIISIPLKGALQHGDDIDNNEIVRPGDIQTMSAGTGIHHSEMNHSDSDPVELLQIWIIPRQNNVRPTYNDYDIRSLLKKNELSLIIAPDGSTPAVLLQDTWFSIGEIEKGKTIDYKIHQSNNGVYIFLIEGKIKIDGDILSRRDGMGVFDTKGITFETIKNAHVLVIEVPMVF